MADFQTELNLILNKTASEITALANRTAGALFNASAPTQTTVVTPSKQPTARKPAAKTAKPVTNGTSNGAKTHGEKRPPAEIEKLQESIMGYLAKHPGTGVEAIGAALKKPTRELTLPLKKLFAGGKIKSEGEKRATKYALNASA